MRLFTPVAALFLFFASGVFGDDNVVFKSDVTMSRVDAQVTDRDGRPVIGLQPNDFVLRVDGKVTPIKNFENENMPMDILLLLDVSGSMRPHVQRMTEAAEQAYSALGQQDRLGIMTFDTHATERLAFTGDRAEVTRELNRLLRFESFDGGTRITSAMIQAASYVQRHARPDARRAIVILTDDETQDGEDEVRVESALSRANAVLSFLQAPYKPPVQGPLPGRRRGSGGGIGFPGGGGGVGFPGGGGGWPGSGGPIGGGGGPQIGRGPMDPSHTAGTETVARDSGGDSMSVNEASALEDTFARLRQRYALHFYMPGEADSQAQHRVRVDLSEQARIRFSGCDVASRRVFLSGSTTQNTFPTVVTRQTIPPDPEPAATSGQTGSGRRRVAVNEDSSSGPARDSQDSASPDTPADDSTTETGPMPSLKRKQPPTPAPQPGQPKHGWPSATPQQLTAQSVR